MAKQYKQLNIRQETYERIVKLQAEYIGKNKQTISLIDFIDLLSYVPIAIL